jgi:AcrR family transcriptional regulator
MFIHTKAMPRTKIISDTAIFATVRQLLAGGGEKAVSFATVAAATGLAASTLVQRYGSRDGMVKAARLEAWDALDAATAAAIATTADKGPGGFLKALEGDLTAMAAATLPDALDEDLRLRAAGWRATVESTLSLRLGGGIKGREAAALLFAVWQGQSLWQTAGGKGFRLKDAVRKLT